MHSRTTADSPDHSRDYRPVHSPVFRPGVMRKCDRCSGEKKKRLQRSPSGRTPAGALPPVVRQSLGIPGHPLDRPIRTYMESRFGHDFGRVRVHADSKAAEAASAVDAQAYTVGSDIVFGAGKYSPGTGEGKLLLAHELAHVIQQGSAGRTALQGRSLEIYDDSGLERDADRMAEAALGGRASAPRGRSRSGVLQRKDKTGKKAKEPGEGYQGCNRRILFENTCAGLAATAGGRCCDPENGHSVPGKTTDVENKACPSQKFTPNFTCDHNCKNSLDKGCDDNDNWMAVPGTKKSVLGQCGDTYTICSGGKKTTGYVRDRSNTEHSYEVSPGIQKTLGVPVGKSFYGAIYRPGASKSAIDKDPCCGAPAKAQGDSATAPKADQQ